MTAKRYNKMFARLQNEQRGAFVPFTVLGDPNMETSLCAILALIEGGADALELGIPFSDPVADGPVIQAAAIRALNNGITPAKCLELIAVVRERFPEIPIGVLTYANILEASGRNTFLKKMAESGVDSILIADLPLFEAEDYCAEAFEHGLETVFIAPPNASEDLLTEVAQRGGGYVYVVARSGVTGTDEILELKAGSILEILSRKGSAPALIGFGISNPKHVKAAIQEGAAGAISGSAIVEIISREFHDKDVMAQKLIEFVRAMRGATK